MASSVNTINSLLNQFTAANNTVVTGLQTGANVSSAEDTRDSIVTQLAQQIGVSTNAGDLGVVERDRRQSRRRDDQYAQPRKLLRFVGEAVDDGHQHVLSPVAGG